MTVLEDVEALLCRNAPLLLCDDCIAEKLNLTVRQHANHKTRQLAREKKFHRFKSQCAACGKTKLVIGVAD